MRPAAIVLFPLVLLAGCSKIHEQRSFTVEAGGAYTLGITAPLSEQKVKIEMTSDEPVNVWVVLEKDVPGGKDEFDPTALQSGVLAKEKNVKQATLTATIPAKEKYRVYIDGAAKKSNVTVRIDSQ
jgi:hypothetical protein